jgi:hypothetical protein
MYDKNFSRIREGSAGVVLRQQKLGLATVQCKPTRMKSRLPAVGRFVKTDVYSVRHQLFNNNYTIAMVLTLSPSWTIGCLLLPKTSSILLLRLPVAVLRFSAVCFANSYSRSPGKSIEQLKHI